MIKSACGVVFGFLALGATLALGYGAMSLLAERAIVMAAAG